MNTLRPEVFVDSGERSDTGLKRTGRHDLLLRPKATFLAELVRCPKSVGAVCASSGRLSMRIAKRIPLQEEGVVVELGGGTGAITRALLSYGVPANKLIVLEKSRRFVDLLHERFPMVRIVHGDAIDIDNFLDGSVPIKAIVSGLPLRSIHRNAVTKITTACLRILPHRAPLIQFTYAPHWTSPWVHAGLRKVDYETVWANFPPARVEVFTHPANC